MIKYKIFFVIKYIFFNDYYESRYDKESRTTARSSAQENPSFKIKSYMITVNILIPERFSKRYIKYFYSLKLIVDQLKIYVLIPSWTDIFSCKRARE